MSRELKTAIEKWVIRVLEKEEKASPEELAILPDLINTLKY